MFFTLGKAAPEHILQRVLVLTYVGGGTVGALGCLGVLRQPGLRPNDEALVLFFLAIYLIGVSCGLSEDVLKKSNGWMGRLFFLLQIPVTQSHILSYHFSVLFSSILVIFPRDFAVRLTWFFGTEASVSSLKSVEHMGFGVNLVPIALLVAQRLLVRSVRKKSPEHP
jgi:hypothetical protein